MHNLEQTIAILRDCETVIRSRIITDREERLLLNALVTQLPIDMLPASAKLVITAIERYNARERKGPYDPAKQGRPSEGKQDATPVAAGEAEAPKGTTEGLEEQAENPGRSAEADAPSALTTTASTEAEEPRKAARRPNSRR